MTQAAIPLRPGTPSPSKLDVSVSHSPQHTIFLRICAAHRALSRGGRHGSGHATSTIDRHAFALRPLHAPDVRGHVPDAMVPIVSRPDVTVREQVDCLHEYPESVLMEDLDLIATFTSAWNHAARHPKRWLSAYADASWAAWQELEPMWAANEHLLARETERVGVGAVRGGMDTVLNTLSPRLRFSGNAFHLDGRTIPVDGRRLLLVPSLVPPDALLIHHSQPEVISVAYPVRGAGTAASPGAARSDDRLAVVLGAPRAALLRKLDAPLVMGAVAAHLGVTPASATRHCDVLANAGLIIRERRGKSVHVARTDAGSELLDLLG